MPAIFNLALTSRIRSSNDYTASYEFLCFPRPEVFTSQFRGLRVPVPTGFTF
jgi:hypothetical protein